LEIKDKKQWAHRITGLYALRRLSAARATQKRSRACALYAFFLRHIFCALELLRNSFIAHKKRRIQPERYTKIFLPRISGRSAPSLARGIYSFYFLRNKEIRNIIM
jgi:hypothetical protein